MPLASKISGKVFSFPMRGQGLTQSIHNDWIKMFKYLLIEVSFSFIHITI